MTDNLHGLRDRVCVVTGGASGIGRAIALSLAATGAQVMVLDRNAVGGKETAELIGRAGARGAFLSCNTADPADVEAAAARTESMFGPCSVLVNNAGVIKPGALDALSFEDWNTLLSINLSGYFLCSQVFGKQMRKLGSGALVHVASIAAHHATPFSGAYSVAKAGVAMLSKQLAVEWGAFNIRSNCVNPGLIITPLSQSMYDRPGVTEARSSAVPAGRVGQPEDVAAAVTFLASDRASYISGDEITVDGGFTRMLLNLIPRAGGYEPSRS